MNTKENNFEISQHRHKATLRPRLFEAANDQVEYGEGTPVAIYVRVSSDIQVDGYSLTAQERLCKELAQKRKYHVVEVYRDEGFSAKDVKRPAFQRMLEDAHNSRFKSIIVHKLDRFSRNIADVTKIIRELHQIGVVFTSVAEDFDFTVPSGRLHFHIMAMFSDWYLQNLSAEAVKAKEQMLIQGRHNGQLPYGYVKDEVQNKPVIVPEEAEVLRQIYDLYLTGEYGDQAIADYLNGCGFRTRKGRFWSKDTIRDTMRNEFYCGKVAHRDRLSQGIQEPIILEETYLEVMALRKKKADNNRIYAVSKVAEAETDSGAKNFPLQRIAYCSVCGHSLRIRPNAKFRYYADTAKERGLTCDARKKSIRIETAEALIIGILQEIKIPSGWQQLISDIALEQDAIVIQKKEKEKIEEKLKRTTKLYVDGLMTQNDFDEKQSKLNLYLQNIVIPEEGTVCMGQLMVSCLGLYIDEANQSELSEICHLLFEKVIINLERIEIVGLKVKPSIPFLLRQSLDPMVWVEEEDGLFMKKSAAIQ